jgi:hypothetical protein
MDYNIYFPPNNEIWVYFLCKCKLGEGFGQVWVNQMVDIQTTKLLNDMEQSTTINCRSFQHRGRILSTHQWLEKSLFNKLKIGGHEPTLLLVTIKVLWG